MASKEKITLTFNIGLDIEAMRRNIDDLVRSNRIGVITNIGPDNSTVFIVSPRDPWEYPFSWKPADDATR